MSRQISEWMMNDAIEMEVSMNVGVIKLDWSFVNLVKALWFKPGSDLDLSFSLTFQYEHISSLFIILN